MRSGMRKRIRSAKEGIEIRNNADSLVYQTEKTVKDLGDKISEADKKAIEEKVEDLKKALAGDDNDMIKKATESLTSVSYEVFGKAYQQTAGQQAGAQGAPERTRASRRPMTTTLWMPTMKSWTTIRIRNKAKIKSIALAAKKVDFPPSLFRVMELLGRGKKKRR